MNGRCLLLLLIGGFVRGEIVAQPPATNLPRHARLRLGNDKWRGSAPIVASFWSPKGQQFVTVGNDYLLLVWDVATGEVAKRLDVGGPTTDLVSVNLYIRPSFRADAKAVAVIGRDWHVRVWDIDQGTALFDERIAGSPQQVALSPDGQRLAVYSQPSTIRLYSVPDRRLLHEMTLSEPGRPNRFVARLDFAPDGKTLLQVGMRQTANGGMQPDVVVWDVASGQAKSQVEKLDDANAVQQIFRSFPTPDLKELAVACGNDLVFFDVASGKERRRLAKPDWLLLSSWCLPNEGNEAVQILGRGDAVVIWDRVQGKVVRRFGSVSPVERRGYVTNASLSPDRKWLAYAEGLAVQMIDLDTGERRGGGGHRTSLLSAYYSPDGQSIVTRSQEAYCRWKASTGNLVQTIQLESPYNGFLLTRDQKWLVATDANMGLQVLDAVTRRPQHAIPLTLNNAYTYSVAPDSRTLIVLGQSVPTVFVFDLLTGEKRAEMPIPASIPSVASAFARRISFSRDSRLVAGNTESFIALWDLQRYRLRSRIDFPTGFVLRQMSFSPDGRLLAVEFYQGEISLWEIASSTRRRTLDPSRKDESSQLNPSVVAQREGTRLPSALQFSPDGRILAQGAGTTIRLFDVRSGRLLGTLEGHRRPVTSLGFSPDSKGLVSASSDTIAYVWDVTPFRESLAPTTADETKADARPEMIESLWSELATRDAERAEAAMQRLLAMPSATLVWLRRQIRPASDLDERRVAQLVADLDAPRYATRQRAKQELERIGEAAIPALERAAEQGSAETRATVRRLLDTATIRPFSPEQLQQIRAIEILERLGETTPEAIALLKELGAGASTSLLTQEARRAGERLQDARRDHSR